MTTSAAHLIAVGRRAVLRSCQPFPGTQDSLRRAVLQRGERLPAEPGTGQWTLSRVSLRTESSPSVWRRMGPSDCIDPHLTDSTSEEVSCGASGTVPVCPGGDVYCYFPIPITELGVGKIFPTASFIAVFFAWATPK